jgi:hypothetical protein
VAAHRSGMAWLPASRCRAKRLGHCAAAVPWARLAACPLPTWANQRGSMPKCQAANMPCCCSARCRSQRSRGPPARGCCRAGLPTPAGRVATRLRGVQRLSSGRGVGGLLFGVQSPTPVRHRCSTTCSACCAMASP